MPTLRNARLPRWLLPEAWPCTHGAPALADIEIDGARIGRVAPSPAAVAALAPEDRDLHGAPVLPGFADAHVHLDKAFTLGRIQDVSPGLLGAIEASQRDLPNWTPQDIHLRASRALQWACEAGTVHLRTHINWAAVGPLPMAWPVLDALAREWAGRVRLELVSLPKLDHFARLEDARLMASQVAATGPHALLGGFVHSVNWNAQSLDHLLQAAQAYDLDIDLHMEEELNTHPQGLRHTAVRLREMSFAGRVVCGHVCALAAQPLSDALATLDEVARAPMTLVSLPITNLLLQDAVTGRTPRLRGITLVKEAQARGIPLLFASDNVQDPFCPVGSFDPMETFAAAVLAAQLDDAFDTWSHALCRTDVLERGTPGAFTLPGRAADLVIFPKADATGFPSRTAQRVVLRRGEPLPATPEPA